MSALADKIRKARESEVPAGGFSFTVRRPTDAEAMNLGGVKPVELLVRFVVGWNLREIEWVSDQPEVMGTLSAAIVKAYEAHAAKREDAAKN
jgi:hypothetical protein